MLFRSALLACKTHFRFQPPNFEVYDAETVEAWRQAEEAQRERDSLVAGGAEWFRRLWESRVNHKPAPAADAAAPLEPVRSRLARLLRARIVDPDTQEDEALWKQVSKGLPDDPHLPLLLAETWGLVPPHYNYWLERADYEPGDAWCDAFAEEIRALTGRTAALDAPAPGGDFVSIDSATMMNKGLEFIEAMHLFAVTPDQIKVIIHPESAIHSMVELLDGTVIAQLGVADMGLPIQYALTYPERRESAAKPMDFAALGSMHFEDPDLEKLPCLRLAMECARARGTAPCVMSAANEIAVGAFLGHRIGYNDIYRLVASAVERAEFIAQPTLEEILASDAEARELVRREIG